MRTAPRNYHRQFHSTFVESRFTLGAFSRHEGVSNMAKATAKKPAKKKTTAKKSTAKKK